MRRFNGLFGVKVEEEEAVGKDVARCSFGIALDAIERSETFNLLVEPHPRFGTCVLSLQSCFCTEGSSRFNNLSISTSVQRFQSL